jgi:hypothetical protein
VVTPISESSYRRQAGVRIRGGCVYAGRGAYTRVGCEYAFIFKMRVNAFNTCPTHTGPNLAS